MKISHIAITWFDLLVVGLLIIGTYRGKRRGLSEELLDVCQWLCIVVLGALVYKPLGEIVAGYTNMGLFYGYVVSYGFTAVLIKFGFTCFKRAVGEKLVQSDAFGGLEYYMGMIAGAVRYFCVLLFAISFLHAEYISDAERAATAQMQEDNFGSISFPTIGSLQHTVFYQSPSGKMIGKYLHDQLMQPADSKAVAHDTLAKWRQREVDEVMK
jgi:uncharacterized membrane protein required for colicin V production